MRVAPKKKEKIEAKKGLENFLLRIRESRYAFATRLKYPIDDPSRRFERDSKPNGLSGSSVGVGDWER